MTPSQEKYLHNLQHLFKPLQNIALTQTSPLIPRYSRYPQDHIPHSLRNMIGEGVPTSPAKEGDDPHQIAHPVHHHQMKGHQMGEDHQEEENHQITSIGPGEGINDHQEGMTPQMEMDLQEVVKDLQEEEEDHQVEDKDLQEGHLIPIIEEEGMIINHDHSNYPLTT